MSKNITKEKIEKLKNEYESTPKEKTDLDTLRELDNKVKFMPKLIAYLIGSISTLVFGVGLTCALEWNNMIFCIICSVIGITGMIISYFIHKIMLEKRKNKYREQILALASKLLNEEK